MNEVGRKEERRRGRGSESISESRNGQYRDRYQILNQSIRNMSRRDRRDKYQHGWTGIDYTKYSEVEYAFQYSEVPEAFRIGLVV